MIRAALLYFLLTPTFAVAYQQVAQFPYFYIDAVGDLSIDQIKTKKFTKADKSNPSWGWTDDIIWLRLNYSKSTDDPEVLEIRYPLLDDVQIYFFRGNRLIQSTTTGDAVENSKDVIDEIDPAVMVPHERGDYEIFFRIETSSSTQAPLYIYPEKEFHQKEKEDFLTMGLYVGIMIVMGIYNMIIFLATRHLAYLFYSLFVLVFAILQIALSGYGFFYLWPEFPFLSDFVICQGGLVATFLMLTFANKFLGFRHRGRRRKKTIEGLMTALGVAFLASLIMPYGNAVKLMALSVLLTVIVTFGMASYQAIVEQQRVARFYCLAWVFFIGSCVIYLLKQLGVLPVNSFTNNAFKIGSVVEVALLSFALADRLNSLKSELSISNKSLKSEINVSRHLLSELKKLIYPHQITMIRDGRSLEETMPQQSKNAVVISFDIQDSSKIGHSENHDFFETVLKKCNRAMTAYYDKVTVSANAFMIKEMGDGFLCSIGFPFSCQGNLIDSALSLADQFVDIFLEQLANHLDDQEAFCSIGIAYGSVTGYFPKTGLKHYDLYGEAIVKATRYEAMRKTLFKNGVEQENIIILQEKVYELLDEESKDAYHRFSLDFIKVRDDDEAKALYYRTKSQRSYLALNSVI